MNWRNVAIATATVLPLLLILWSGFGNNPQEVPFVLKDRPAPDIELTALDGTPFQLQDARGKPVVVNFWSTWCEPCKVEHELLQQASRYYGDKVQFVGIVYQDTAAAASTYLMKRSNGFPQLHDPTSSTAMDYGVSGVPESFFIGADGMLKHKQAGVVTAPLLRDKIGAMLAHNGDS